MAISDDNAIDGDFKKGVHDRLLDAAEALFAEKGFEATSVRQLACAAGCNVASVNYYFGGKENLYLEVWRRDLRAMLQKRIASIKEVMAGGDGPASLEDLLRSFANAFLEPLVDKAKAHRLMKLMAREMLDQHLPASMFVEDVVIPTMEALREALLRTCPELDEYAIPAVIFSLVGQLIQGIRIQALLSHTGSAGLPAFDLGEFVEHIVRFSAAGIRAYAQEQSK